MPARAAHFPNAFVGAIPGGLKKFHDGMLDAPSIFAGRQPQLPGLVQGVHHFAVNIQLKLLGGRIADTHRG